MEIIHFPYKHPCIKSCRIPGERLGRIYKMNKVSPIVNLEQAVKDVVNNPIGTDSLKEICARARSVAIIVDDLSRPTPVDRIIPYVLNELLKVGVKKEEIIIVLALGSHRLMTREEITAKIGTHVAKEYRVINSRFNDPAHLTYMGSTGDGVKVYIEEEVARASVKICIGSIVPHAAVGWSGGGKILYPGVAGEETVIQFHFMHGITEENMTGQEECLVRRRMEKWVNIVGLDFIVNCVLTPEHQVYKIVAGHYIKAHRSGVAFAKEVYCQKIQERMDIVIAVSYPHDIDFWQGAKGIYAGEALLKDGGTLLLITPCPEGLGNHPDFLKRIGQDDVKQELLKLIRGELPLPKDPISLAPAAMLSKMKKRFHCALVSHGLSQ